MNEVAGDTLLLYDKDKLLEQLQCHQDYIMV